MIPPDQSGKLARLAEIYYDIYIFMRTVNMVRYLWIVLAFVSSVAQAEPSLLMFEQPGCQYCARWHAEVGPEYPKTAEGKLAPLVQLDLKDPLPPGTELKSKPIFTPTFVLVDDGVEIGRIEGYPGEDFFWPLLDQILAELKPSG